MPPAPTRGTCCPAAHLCAEACAGLRAGLGARASGITAPVGVGGANGAMGVGMANPGEVTKDDDPFDQYRKRMQLAYKFRPNPNNNPRRAYDGYQTL